MQLDGTISRDHYWWLAYEWDNLYLTCPDCERHKGPRFPVDGTRAKPEARGEDLDVEKPLLLDPCRDQPEHVFAYADDATLVATEKRSRTTIDVLGLNRAALVEARLEAMNQVHQLLRDDIPVGNLRQQFEEGMPYAGIRR